MTDHQYKILKFISGFNKAEISIISDNASKTISGIELENIIDELEKLEYIIQVEYAVFSITQNGRESLLTFQSNLSHENEVKELNLKKLRLDIKNSQRIFNTYWGTFGISILGLVLAISKIIYDALIAK